MAKGDDPLQELLLDAQEVDRARLAKGLAGLLGVDTKSGSLVLKPGFNKLNTRQRILAYLLGRKAASLLGKLEEEPAAHKTIYSETGMPSGTVGPKTRELLEDRLVSQTDDKKYYIEQHQVMNAIDELSRGVET